MLTSDRARIARFAADGLRRCAGDLGTTAVMVGFDGFVDSIIDVVDTRQDAGAFTAIPTITRFAQKILAAAGQSSNFELVVKRTKLGGNGPIMANALASLGLGVTYVGALGHPDVHPVFEELANRSTVLSFCDPGFTDALEFADGKLMLGKHAALGDVTLARLLAVVGADPFRTLVARSRLLAMVNWTMLTATDTIWRHLIEDVLPALDSGGVAPRKLVFVDLADPEKRTRKDLLSALELCGRFMPFADVTLGFNSKEAAQVTAVLGIRAPPDLPSALPHLARAIRERLGVTTVVIHPRDVAAAATLASGSVESAGFSGPFVREPRLSTGAGDNFNAGFVLGQLAGLPVDQCLCTGTACSGYYVRNAASPDLAQLAAFCDNLPPAQS